MTQLNRKPSNVYQLVTDPDLENGLLLPGRQLLLSNAEIEHGLAASVFTPGAILRHLRKHVDYRVDAHGNFQYLTPIP